MANPQPVAEVRIDRVKAAIWQNEPVVEAFRRF